MHNEESKEDMSTARIA